MISLKRSNGADWSNSVPSSDGVCVSKIAAVQKGSEADASQAPSASSVVAASVAENVTSFLSGIRASFRQDNVNVMSIGQSKRSVPRPESGLTSKNTNDIKN